MSLFMFNSLGLSFLDWDLLHGDESLWAIATHSFQGNLLRNVAEGPLLREFFTSLTFNCSQMINDIFSNAAERGQGISPQDPLCRSCLYTFLRTNSMEWWMDRKRLGTNQAIVQVVWYF